MLRHRLAIAILLSVAAGCAGSVEYIPGTQVPTSSENRAIIERVEEYRLAVERKDAAALVLMASQDYWEDAGTPGGEDDFGYDGLKDVLATRFQLAESIRYAVRYMKVRRHGCDDEGPRCLAFVDVLIDASFSVPDARGQLSRHDMRDQNQFVLEWDGDKWLFLSGM